MSQKINSLWEEIEKLDAAKSTGYLLRQLDSATNGKIFVGVSQSSRCFIVKLNNNELSKFNREFDLRGISLKRMPDPKRPKSFSWLLLILTDENLKGVFTSLCDDLVESIGAVKIDKKVIRLFIDRLDRWQAMFERYSVKGLSVEAQRGLYGELLFIYKMLQKRIDKEICITSWVGCIPAIQDFQGNGWALEVKTSSGNKHHKIIVSSERQLDDDFVDSLFLLHFALDVRPSAQNTLNHLVDQIRKSLKTNQVLLSRFKEKLNQGGYYDEQKGLYAEVGYQVRNENFFSVEDDFPRIKECNLPKGVGDVVYSITLDKCMSHQIEERKVLKLVSNG